jgi:hypothetical protein
MIVAVRVDASPLNMTRHDVEGAPQNQLPYMSCQQLNDMQLPM